MVCGVDIKIAHAKNGVSGIERRARARAVSTVPAHRGSMTEFSRGFDSPLLYHRSLCVIAETAIASPRAILHLPHFSLDSLLIVATYFFIRFFGSTFALRVLVNIAIIIRYLYLFALLSWIQGYR